MHNSPIRNNKLLREAYLKGYRRGLNEESPYHGPQSGFGASISGPGANPTGNQDPGGPGNPFGGPGIQSANYAMGSGTGWNTFMNYIGSWIPADMGLQQWWNMANIAGPSFNWAQYGFAQTATGWQVELPGYQGIIQITWSQQGWQVVVMVP